MTPCSSHCKLWFHSLLGWAENLNNLAKKQWPCYAGSLDLIISSQFQKLRWPPAAPCLNRISSQLGKSQTRNWKEKTEIERNTNCIWGEIWHPCTQQWLYLPTYRWQWSDDLEGRDGHGFGVQSLEWGIGYVWFVKGPLTRVLAPGSGNIEMMVELIDIRARGPELAQGLRNWWEVWPSFGIQGYFPPNALMMPPEQAHHQFH